MGTNGDQISVVIVEDHDLVREGLRALIEQEGDIQVVGHARGQAEAIAVISETEPDVVLLDLRLGEEDGAEVSRSLRDNPDAPRVLILSAHERPSDLRSAMDAGAAGYVLKGTTPELLLDAIRQVSRGERVIDQAFVPMLVGLPAEPNAAPDITAREMEVLLLIAEGLPNRTVAERLGITQSTAQTHLESLFRKFNAHDRTELVAKAFRRDYLS